MSEPAQPSPTEKPKPTPIPRAWVALALFGFGSVIIPLSMVFGADATAKFWRWVIAFAAGLCFLAAGVIWGVHRNQTAELLRRKYRVMGVTPLLPEQLSRQLRGEKVTIIHRVMAINLGIVVGLFGLALVLASSIGLIVGLSRHDLPIR